MKFLPLLWVLFAFSFLECCSSPDNSQKNKKEKSEKPNHQNPLKSEISCPKCRVKKWVTMPTDVCLIKYKCTNCKAILYPKDGDCCVFCSYGTHDCPSMQ